MTIAAIVIVLAAFVLFFLIEPRRCSVQQAEIFCRVNYAHRGLHTKDKSVPENSLTAFRLAAEAGYGIEMDIRLTRDGQVVVFHDDDLSRVCGEEGMVSQLDYEALQSYRLCGTQEQIPLFARVLEEIGGRVPVIVELKTGKRNKELCQKAVGILQAYEGPFCIESFDPRIVAWFNRHKANIFRGQLTNSYSEMKKGTSKAAAFAVSMMLTNFLSRPHFIAHGKGKKSLPVLVCEWLGAKRFSWTIRDTDDTAEWEKRSDGVIFEHYTPKTFF